MIIYKATNIINDMCYIGQTVCSINKRLKEHKHSSKHSQNYLYRAIRKYRWDNFIWEVIDDTCQTKDELDEMEYHYIKQYHSHVSKYGYNLTWGGEGSYGYKHTDNTKKRMRDNHADVSGKKNPNYGSRGQKNPNSKTYKVTFPNGDSEIIVGLPIFCKQYNLGRGNMTLVAQGIKEHHKGYKCEYYETVKAV